MRSSRRGQTLVALLVVVVIAIGLYMLFLGSRRGPEGEVRPSVARQSLDRANAVSIDSNIQQIEMCLGMYKADNDGRAPATLEEAKSYCKDYPAEMWVDAQGRPLQYDAQTGRVYSATSAGQAPAGQAPAAPGNANPGGVPAVPAPGGNIPPDLLQ